MSSGVKEMESRCTIQLFWMNLTPPKKQIPMVKKPNSRTDSRLTPLPKMDKSISSRSETCAVTMTLRLIVGKYLSVKLFMSTVHRSRYSSIVSAFHQSWQATLLRIWVTSDSALRTFSMTKQYRMIFMQSVQGIILKKTAMNDICPAFAQIGSMNSTSRMLVTKTIINEVTTFLARQSLWIGSVGSCSWANQAQTMMGLIRNLSLKGMLRMARSHLQSSSQLDIFKRKSQLRTTMKILSVKYMSMLSTTQQPASVKHSTQIAIISLWLRFSGLPTVINRIAIRTKKIKLARSQRMLVSVTLTTASCMKLPSFISLIMGYTRAKYMLQMKKNPQSPEKMDLKSAEQQQQGQVISSRECFTFVGGVLLDVLGFYCWILVFILIILSHSSYCHEIWIIQFRIAWNYSEKEILIEFEDIYHQNRIKPKISNCEPILSRLSSINQRKSP